MKSAGSESSGASCVVELATLCNKSGMSSADTLRPAVMAHLVQAGRKWRKLAQLALAAHDISQAQGGALVWGHRLGGGVRQIVLASYIGIEGTSLVRLLDELSAAGLLVRKDDPSDRRAKTIWLTPKGELLAQRIETVLSTLRERVLEGVSDADIDAALRVCAAIDRAGQVACVGSAADVDKLLVKDVEIDLPGCDRVSSADRIPPD